MDWQQQLLAIVNEINIHVYNNLQLIIQLLDDEMVTGISFVQYEGGVTLMWSGHCLYVTVWEEIEDETIYDLVIFNKDALLSIRSQLQTDSAAEIVRMIRKYFKNNNITN